MREERLKHVAEVRVSNVDKKTIDGDRSVTLCNYTDVYYNERITGSLTFMTATATPEQWIHFRLRKDDVVLTKDSETADDIGVSAIVAETIPDLVCGYHLAVIRPRGDRATGPFLRWAIASTAARERMAAAATGVTRFGLRSESIADLPIPLPSLATQRAIAGYLDRETARIDALIAAKKRMLELLETRLAILAESRLLDSAVRLVPLRRLLKTLPQYGASESGEPGELDWPRYIRITDLSSAGSLRSEGVLRLAPPTARPYLLADQDVLVARSGATVGKAFIYKREMGQAAFAGYLIRLRFDVNVVRPGLVEAWTRTEHYWRQVREASLQATIQNVSAERYKELIVPVPRIDQQDRILKELATARSTIDHLVNTIGRQLRLLQEHRQALITAAVTGEFGMPEAA